MRATPAPASPDAASVRGSARSGPVGLLAGSSASGPSCRVKRQKAAARLLQAGHGQRRAPGGHQELPARGRLVQKVLQWAGPRRPPSRQPRRLWQPQPARAGRLQQQQQVAASLCLSAQCLASWNRICTLRVPMPA